jgi:hypothetical protein
MNSFWGSSRNCQKFVSFLPRSVCFECSGPLVRVSRKPTTPLLSISDHRRVQHFNADGFVEIGR